MILITKNQMSINLRIEGIIHHSIFTERNCDTLEEYKINIVRNLNSIDFQEKITNYESCGKSLHVSRPRMRTLLYTSIVLNKKLFEEIGYEKYSSREGHDISDNDVWELIEECVNILVKKQKCKN